jgi:hypothetical protein
LSIFINVRNSKAVLGVDVIYSKKAVFQIAEENIQPKNKPPNSPEFRGF